MADEPKSPESTEDPKESRRVTLPEWWHPATETEEVAGFTIVGEFPPEYVQRHRAWAMQEPVEPGDDPGLESPRQVMSGERD